MLKKFFAIATLLLGITPLAYADSVIYEFYAPWCHVCKALAPKIAKLQKEGIRIERINIDENEAMANKYHIRAVPTTILVKDGEVKESLVGNLSMKQLKALAEEAKD